MIDEWIQQRAVLEGRKRRYRRRRLFLRIGSGCLGILLLVFCILFYGSDLVFGPPEGMSSSPQTGEWSMFHRNPARTGGVADSGIPPAGTIKWVFPTEGAVHSSPAVVGGIVYVGSRDGNLYALDAGDGREIWRYTTGSWVDSSPAVADGTVFCGSNDGNLYALDAATGEPRWIFRAEYNVMSSPAIADGVVYFGSHDYRVYAVAAATGKKLWDWETEGTVISSPVVADGIVYIGSQDGFIYALHARDGRLHLKFRASAAVISSPSVNEDNVYFGDSDGYLYAVAGEARNWIWENTLTPLWRTLYFYGVAPPSPYPSGLVWYLKLGERIVSSPAVDDDSLYIGADTRLFSVDIDTREERWVFEADGDISSSPAVVGGTIYAGSESGRLYALDAVTGEGIWSVRFDGGITSSPAVVGGTVYIGSRDGNVYAIE